MSEKKETLKSKVAIYTDGGCDPNPGIGGWAAVLISANHKKEISGGALHTTNNRMELTAAIEALSALKRPCVVDLYTDSQYLVKGMTQWLQNWKLRKWRRGGKEVLNKELWQMLDDLAHLHDVRWHWLRGHSGHAYNERCDALANEEIHRQRNG